MHASGRAIRIFSCKLTCQHALDACLRIRDPTIAVSGKVSRSTPPRVRAKMRLRTGGCVIHGLHRCVWIGSAGLESGSSDVCADLDVEDQVSTDMIGRTNLNGEC
jgi:hypothetical protein